MIDLSGKAVGNDLYIYSIKLVILCTYTPQRPVLCNYIPPSRSGEGSGQAARPLSVSVRLVESAAQAISERRRACCW